MRKQRVESRRFSNQTKRTFTAIQRSLKEQIKDLPDFEQVEREIMRHLKKLNLTERQIKSIQTKIQRIKKALADDKKHWGGQYHDGRGLRYLPPEQYLKLQDYSGAQRYFNWFHKNFPNDSGYPDFLFEWTITLFYCGRLKEAEKKAITTHLSNQYYFDKYFNKPIVRLEKRHYLNLEYPEMAESFAYTSTQEHLAEFTKWLEQFVKSDKFTTIITQYNELEEQLSKESDVPRRSKMINLMHKIKYSED